MGRSCSKPVDSSIAKLSFSFLSSSLKVLPHELLFGLDELLAAEWPLQRLFDSDVLSSGLLAEKLINGFRVDELLFTLSFI